MERLENIHIEKYPFTIQERPILALIKLYLNTTDEPVKAVDRALSSKVGLEVLIENAKTSVEIKEEYSEFIKKLLAIIAFELNCEKCAEMYQDRIKPFLEDCRRELVGCGAE